LAAVLFLDRDGVLNEKAPDGGYVTRPDAFRILPDVPEALAELRARVPGLRIAVVTNQRGVARGLVDSADLAAIHGMLDATLRAAGGWVDRIEVCPHEIGACDCRKPALGMFHRALAALACADPAACAVVGDSAADIEAGSRLGARTWLVGDPARRAPERAVAAEHGAFPDGEADTLPDLVRGGELVAWLRAGAASIPRAGT
jgi:D-glycero-D-manno-heptose 1,7-bisphosphate phosphatase